jgi:hypothetical protein
MTSSTSFGQTISRQEARHLQTQHQLEMAFIASRMRAWRTARWPRSRLRMPAEQGKLRHPLGRDLHDLDGDHAAEREPGQRELAGRHPVDHPACGLVPAVENRQRRLAPIRHDDLGHVFQRRHLRAIQPG